MYKLIPLFILFLVLPVHADWMGTEYPTFNAEVIKIESNNVIILSNQGLMTKVTLAGIDCPELDQPFGIDVYKFLRGYEGRFVGGVCMNNLLDGIDDFPEVILNIDRRSINAYLVMRGYAEAKRIKDNEQQTFFLKALEEQAKHDFDGMWRLGKKYISPKDWREMTKDEKAEYLLDIDEEEIHPPEYGL